jgi:hypothetical protein
MKITESGDKGRASSGSPPVVHDSTLLLGRVCCQLWRPHTFVVAACLMC